MAAARLKQSLGGAADRRAAAYTELGTVLKARGRTAEAKHALRKSLVFTPGESAAYLLLAPLAQPREAVQLLHAYDRDSDGRLDLAEFALLLRKMRASGGFETTSTAASLRAAFRASYARRRLDLRRRRAAGADARGRRHHLRRRRRDLRLARRPAAHRHRLRAVPAHLPRHHVRRLRRRLAARRRRRSRRT